MSIDKATIERLAREAGMHLENAVRVDLKRGGSEAVGTAEIMRAPVDQLERFAALVRAEALHKAHVIASDPNLNAGFYAVAGAILRLADGGKP